MNNSMNNSMTTKSLAIHQQHSEHLAEKIANDDYENEQSMKEAKNLLLEKKYVSKEREYEKLNIESKKKSVMNMNTLLMNKEYLNKFKKFRDINHKGKSMMKL